MITAVWTGAAVIPSKLTEAIMDDDPRWDAQADNDLSVLLSGIDNVYFTDQRIRRHVDGIDGNMVTHGLVLMNSLGARLNTTDGIFDIPQGSLFRLDQTKPHGTIAKGKARRPFCFIADDLRTNDPNPHAIAARLLASARAQFHLPDISRPLRPLSATAIGNLRNIAANGPTPKQIFNPGVMRRLQGDGLITFELLPTPYTTRSGNISNAVITEAGRLHLADH